MKLGMSP